jgi:hypothetical protein
MVIRDHLEIQLTPDLVERLRAIFSPQWYLSLIHI